MTFDQRELDFKMDVLNNNHYCNDDVSDSNSFKYASASFDDLLGGFNTSNHQPITNGGPVTNGDLFFVVSID